MTLIDAHGIARPPTPRPTAAPPQRATTPATGRAGDQTPEPAAPAMTTADAEARLTALYRDHAGAVLRFARRRIDPAAADDVVAETFLIAWRRRDNVPADALPWLYAVAGNVLRTQRRSARRLTSLRARLAAEPGAALGASPTSSGSSETDHAVLRAIAALRPNDREAILLTAWEELSAERAAAVVGCSPAAFHVRLHRARKRLATALDRADAADRKDRA